MIGLIYWGIGAKDAIGSIPSIPEHTSRPMSFDLPRAATLLTILIESKGKSCRSSLKNTLIEHSAVQWHSNQPVTSVCCFVLVWSMYVHTRTQRSATGIPTALRQANFTHSKASRVNIRWEIIKTRDSKVQFSPDACFQQRATFGSFCAFALIASFRIQISNSLVLHLFAVNCNVWKRV